MSMAIMLSPISSGTMLRLNKVLIFIKNFFFMFYNTLLYYPALRSRGSFFFYTKQGSLYPPPALNLK